LRFGLVQGDFRDGKDSFRTEAPAMKPRVEEEDNSLDSLLDTLTNVVAILVILLIVTQLSVSESVEKITSSIQVDPAALAKAQEELDALLAEKAELDEQLAALTTDPAELQAKIAVLERKIADNEANRRALEQYKQEREAKAEQQAAAARKKLEEQDQAAKKLKEELQQALAKLAKLEAKLHETPVPELPPAKVVNLPDPRPAPEGAEPVTFFCWRDRVFTINLEELREQARKRFEFVVNRYRLKHVTKGILEKETIEKFNQQPPRDKYFTIELVARGPWPHLRLTPKFDEAETGEQIKRYNSDFRTRVRRLRANGNYARFLVWPDSFETYLIARQMTEREGALAGWQMISDRDDYLYSIGGGNYRFGPPPKPDPNPKPKPKPSGPKPPPQPVDEID
jgi:hypothetical protein